MGLAKISKAQDPVELPAHCKQLARWAGKTWRLHPSVKEHTRHSFSLLHDEAVLLSSSVAHPRMVLPSEMSFIALKYILK